MTPSNRAALSTSDFAMLMARPMTDLGLLGIALEEIASEVFGDPKDSGKLRPTDRLLADLRLGDDGLALCDVALAIERRSGYTLPHPPQDEISLETFLHSLAGP